MTKREENEAKRERRTKRKRRDRKDKVKEKCEWEIKKDERNTCGGNVGKR